MMIPDSGLLFLGHPVCEGVRKSQQNKDNACPSTCTRYCIKKSWQWLKWLSSLHKSDTTLLSTSKF